MKPIYLSGSNLVQSSLRMVNQYLKSIIISREGWFIVCCDVHNGNVVLLYFERKTDCEKQITVIKISKTCWDKISENPWPYHYTNKHYLLIQSLILLIPLCRRRTDVQSVRMTNTAAPGVMFLHYSEPEHCRLFLRYNPKCSVRSYMKMYNNITFAKNYSAQQF